MAGYIEIERVIQEIKGMDNCGCITRNVNHVCEDIRSIPTADVVERSKIDDAIAEIKDGYYGNEEKSETDSERADAFNNGLSYALEILERNIGESKGDYAPDTNVGSKKGQDMTKEELEYNRGYRYGYERGNLNGYKLRKSEEKPCEDVVSRQAVHDMLENLPITGEDKWFNWLQKACMRLAALPPVTPARKKGKWIRVGSGSLIDDFRCDCCNKQPPIKKVGDTWGWDFTRYCPNCGSENL